MNLIGLDDAVIKFQSVRFIEISSSDIHSMNVQLCETMYLQARNLYSSISHYPTSVAGVSRTHRWLSGGLLNPVTQLSDEEQMMRDTGDYIYVFTYIYLSISVSIPYTVSRFAREKIQPLVREMDEKSEMDKGIIKGCLNKGYECIYMCTTYSITVFVYGYLYIYLAYLFINLSIFVSFDLLICP